MKRYANASLLYALIAMAGGVFYREFTKLNGFTGKTTLSVFHTHYFLLGMVVFLLLLLSEKVFAFSGEKMGRVLALYHTGLNITGRGPSRPRHNAGSGHAAVPRSGRRDFRRCRHRTSALGISLVRYCWPSAKRLRTPCLNHRRKAPRRPLASAGFAGPGRKRTKFLFFLSLREDFFPDLRFYG